MRRCALFATLLLAGSGVAYGQEPGADVGYILRPTEAQSGDPLEVFPGAADDGEPAPPASAPLLGPTGEEPIGPPLAGPTREGPIGPPLAGPNPRAAPAEARPRRRERDPDPFAATGIRLGTFIIRPSIEIGVTASDNPAGAADGEPATGLVVAPEVEVRSEDTDYEVAAQIQAEGVFYGEDRLDEREMQARIAGRYDLTSRTSVEGEAGYSYNLDRFNDPETPAGAAQRPAVQRFDAEIGATQRFSRLSVGVAAGVEREVYGEVALAGGGTASREAQNNTELSVRTRVGYEASAAMTPFGEAEIGRRNYDLEADASGLERGGVWGELRGGILFDFGSKLSGEAALGYRREDFEDEELEDLGAVTAAASVMWSPRRLTEIRFRFSTDVQPTTIPGASGSILYSGTLTAARLVSPRVRLEAGAGFDYERFIGADLRESTLSGFAGFSYAFNRMASLEARYVHERTDSTDPASDATANTVTVRVRLQR